MKQQRPYLFDAIYRWVLDSDATPHLLVNTSVQGVSVPQYLIQDDQILLNISPSAIMHFQSEGEAIYFSARFSGKEQSICVPYSAMLALFAKETGQGMVFPPDVGEPSLTESDQKNTSKTKSKTSNKKGKPKFTVVK